MKRHRYKFPIGDWSSDGHGKCDYFTVSGDKPVEEVGKSHDKCIDVLGFHIGDICSEYEEFTLRWDIYEKLRDAGFTIEKYTRDIDLESEEIGLGDTEGLVELWVDILNHIDPGLNLTVEKDKCPAFQHHVKAHGCPGYGCFY